MTEQPGPAAKALYRRILVGASADKAQVAFAVGVLDRYREAGFALKRTNTVGRVSAPGWRIDFGIAAGEDAIHASFGDLARLPEREREHWAGYVTFAPLSENYLKMLLHPGSCIDDGDTRDW